MSDVEVSVVIPTRNRWKLLRRRALRAVELQQGVNHEVIVVDDGSTDDTPQRLREDEGPTRSVIRLETNEGVSRARNAGIEKARGSWIAFLDDDDSWSPDKLRAQLEAVRTSGADFAYCGVLALDDRTRVLYEFPLPDPDGLPRASLAACPIPAGCSNVLVRTELIRSLGGFDERLLQLADWDLWIRLAWAGKAVAVAERLVGYVEHDENMLLSQPRDPSHEFEYLREKHRSLRLQSGVELDRVNFSHWVAWGHLRRRRRLKASKVYLQSGITNHRPQDVALAAAFALRACFPLRGLRAAPVADPVAAEPAWLALYR